MEQYKNDPAYSMFNSRLIGLDEAGFALVNEKLGNVLDKNQFMRFRKKSRQLGILMALGASRKTLAPGLFPRGDPFKRQLRLSGNPCRLSLYYAPVEAVPFLREYKYIIPEP